MSIKWKIFNKAFGIPSECKEAYATASKDLDRCVVECLLQEPHVSDISRAAIANTRNSVEKLITTSFNPNVGLEPWERHASCKLRISRGLDSALEVSIFPLLTSFIGHMTLPIIFGKAFVAKSPDVVEDIDLLDDSFLSMIIGLPPWLPIPSLKRAYEARDRPHRGLACLYSSLNRTALGLDPGPDWRDLSDVSQLIKDLDAIWKNVGLSVSARAAAGLSISWA
ncbi:Cholesterol 7-alpha-monooxygenase [Varicellaria rhodocarpa]|nr:Cholesterol 7-alpha-monooxygenase [Varicellaria rhodocarpa]